MDRRRDLERELRDRRDDFDLWQIYADHLAEIGDEQWAHWIQLNIAGERGGKDADGRQALRMAIGSEEMLGPALRAMAQLRIITLEHGFIGHAELDLAGPPGTYDHSTDLAPLRALLGHPAARFLRRLDLRIAYDNGGENEVIGTLAALAAFELASLTELTVLTSDVTDETEFALQIDEVAAAHATHAAVFRAAPRLREFRVDADRQVVLLLRRDGTQTMG